MLHTQTSRPSCHWGSNLYVAIFAAILIPIATGAAQVTDPPQPSVTWAQDVQKDPALVAAFGQLITHLRQGVQLPPPRGESRLLPLLPESTVLYTAFPNYGDASHQILTIFEQELKQSPALRAWWSHGELATNAPRIEDALEKFYQLSQFLGEEVVLSVATEGRQGPSLLILAEIRKPGLKDFLQTMSTQLTDGSKPPFRVFDVKSLATSANTFPPQEPVILVHPDLFVASLDFAQLRMINAQLDRGHSQFASSPFGVRVAQAYDGGTTLVGGVNLQSILRQVPPGSGPNQMIFHQSGFDEMKYLVWNHRTIAGQAASEMELSFTGPRHGIASWLAAPGPTGSLDFVSPQAVVVSAIRLKSPADILDDLMSLSANSNPQAFAGLAQMESALKVNLKEDILRRLGGEITLELDSLTQPNPLWKAILQVNDPESLQATLNSLLAATHLGSKPFEQDGVTYRTLPIPSPKKTLEISYAFVDGYLVIASSQAGAIEAVRVHRSGESLAKSSKFLAAFPPGNGPNVSAIFYEDPTTISALSMAKIFPQMAESFSQNTAETKPVMVCVYGDETAIRETSLSGGVDAGMVLAGAAIAIPNLLRARMAANESSAVAAIRTANTAQISYSSMYPDRGFAPDLTTLGPDPKGSNQSSADHASLIDATLGNSTCTASTWCTKSGYQFRLTALCKKQSCDEYVVVGSPVSGSTGSRSFCSTSEAVVRFKSGGSLTAPVSVSECHSWLTLQ